LLFDIVGGVCGGVGYFVKWKLIHFTSVYSPTHSLTH